MSLALPSSLSSLNLVIGGVATTYLAKHLGLPNDPVTTMIGTTIISSLISEIETSVKSTNLPINLFELRRKLGLSSYTVIIDPESIYYQKIITYLISNYKKILIQDNVEHNYNLDVDITNIKFTKNKIIETYLNHRIAIGLNQSTKNIIIESSTLDVTGIKKYIQEIVSKNTFTTYLNLFLPIITHEIEPSNKKRKRDDGFDPKVKEVTRSIVKWKNLQVYTNKNLANTILSKSVQTELVDDLNNFIASEEYYNSKGIPFKRGYLLHGPPGTGKTSIIKAFASTYGFDIYIINMENVTQPEDIVQIFRGFDSAHSFHIICFEDIDRCPMFKSNNNYYDQPNPNNNLGVRTLLNELDGIIEGNKRITVFTANNTSVLDKIEALCRPGRIDKKIEVGYCDSDQITRLFAHYSGSEFDSRSETESNFQMNPGTKITPANAVKTILSNTSMTWDEFKQKLNLSSNGSAGNLETNLNTEQNLDSQANSTIRSRRWQQRRIIPWDKITKMMEKESDATNQLIEKITTCGTLQEIRDSVPNIIWGRNTRVKNIRKGLRDASFKYKQALGESNESEE